MNWYDYTRGYDDGMEDGRTYKRNNSLLITLLQLLFHTLTRLLKLCFFILSGSLVLFLAIIKKMAGRRRWKRH